MEEAVLKANPDTKKPKSPADTRRHAERPRQTWKKWNRKERSSHDKALGRKTHSRDHREEGNLDRSTSRGLLRRERCETLWPKDKASTLAHHRLQEVEVEALGTSTGDRPSRTEDPSTLATRNRNESTLQKSFKSTERNKDPGETKKPSHGADRHRTTGEVRSRRKIGCL